jgi:ubiquinone/menaquinone biosynthesis C-methylase UbiE
MKLSYVRGSEQDGARFWLRRVGWAPSEAAKKIAQENDLEKTGYVVDVGGGHGREATWLAEQGFRSILVEPNKYSLRFAKRRAKNKRLNVLLINAALPFLPMCSEVVDVVDFYWTLHQVPDEHKLESLREIARALSSTTTLIHSCGLPLAYSSNTGKSLWENGHQVV